MSIEFGLLIVWFTIVEFWERSSWLDVIAYVAIGYAVYRAIHFVKRLRVTYEN